jgi:capsular polysaccharide transport system permease protein
VLRDLVARYAEYRLGFLLSIIMPLITIGVIMLAFGMRSRAVPADFSMPVFLATGFPLWLAFIGTYGRVVSAASKNDALMMFPQITQLDVIIASVILEFAINTGVFTVLIVLVSVFARSVPRDPAGVMLLFWSCTWLGAVFGLIMCSIGRLFPLVINILNTFLRFGMWVSGVVFMVDKMPVWSWKYLAWNPILHAVEGTRQQWSQTYQSPIFSPGFLLGFGCVLTIVGMLMERASRRFVH